MRSPVPPNWMLHPAAWWCVDHLREAVGDAACDWGVAGNLTPASDVFVFGHLLTIAEAGIFPGVDVLAGEHVAAFLLPDIVSCHDWAYDHIWA